jgi:sodium transport system permease protein
MSWTNVRLIWHREVRDQLRDRRTIFTIAVLPVLLYPLLGMCFLRMTQFLKEEPTRIWLIGSAALPSEPRLLEGERFVEDVCPASEATLLRLHIAAALPGGADAGEPRAAAQREIRRDAFDAVVYFPPDFAARLAAFRVQLQQRRAAATAASEDLSPELPQPEVFVNLANDKSRIAFRRVDTVLRRWRDAIVRQNLADSQVPVAATQPFEVTSTDVSEETLRRAVVWSKLLPFVALIWALTGAFYPAIDLCAGEKERGTLETLLCSPVGRREIVWGKLLTVSTFSMVTSLLNLLCMVLTGTFIIRQLERLPDANLALDLGPPPASAVVWLVLALVPIAVLFSALALAISAFARSTKEGQYYLMPLLFVTLPLMLLPLLPTAHLDFGASVIPVTGIMLWLRALIEGQYLEAVRFAVPVLGVTAACAGLAIRWATRQFENESVLFRESERFGLGLWVQHLVRDRGRTPTVAEAGLCGLLLLLITFFASLRAVVPDTWAAFVRSALVVQLGMIAGPTLIMTLILTRDVKATLLVTAPRPAAVPAAFLLAVTLHPLVVLLGHGIEALYPLREETVRALAPLRELMQGAPLASLLLILAATPAICEELAFRGFILSGLRERGAKWTAIALSAAFFGLTHGMLQQSLAAGVVGLVLGYVAVQSGSLLPGMVFHFTHNTLLVLVGRVTVELLERHPWLAWVCRTGGSESLPNAYPWPVTMLCSAIGLLVLVWFQRLPRTRRDSR